MMNSDNRYQTRHNAEIEQLEQELREIEEAKNNPPAPRTENDLPPEEQSFKKRYGDLRRHAQRREDELKAELKTLKDELAVLKREKVDFPRANVTDEEIQSWAERYPDAYNKVLRIAETQARLATQDLQEKLREQEEREQRAARVAAYQELLRLHPDFDEIKVTDDFVSWAETQPSWVYKALYENDTDAQSAARAVDLYKMDRKIGKKGRDAPRDDTATAVRRSGSPTPSSTPELKWTESKVQAISWREYEKHEAEISEAMKNPAFYDLSGGAR